MRREPSMSHASTSPDGLEGVAGGWTGEEVSGQVNRLLAYVGRKERVGK